MTPYTIKKQLSYVSYCKVHHLQTKRKRFQLFQADQGTTLTAVNLLELTDPALQNSFLRIVKAIF